MYTPYASMFCGAEFGGIRFKPTLAHDLFLGGICLDVGFQACLCCECLSDLLS